MIKDLENRFTYHEPETEEKVQMYTDIRDKAFELASLIDELCPDSREKSLAITALEEAVMWANKSISVNK